MVKWGFIGCGDVTEKKSGPAFSKIEGSKVIAVMRRDGEKAKDYAVRHGIEKWYDDAYKIIKDPEINAVYIATPPSTHAEYAIKAMKAGKPVYVEKPMAASYAECLEMVKVSKETGIPCFVAYYRRSLPYFLKVKELVDMGVLGKISNIQVQLVMPPFESDLKRETLVWRVKKEIAGAGYFYDLAPHQFDILDFIFGKITQVEGFAENLGGYYDVEDTVSAAFRFESGLIGSGSWSFIASENNRVDKIEIIGSTGKLNFSTFGFSPITLETPDGTVQFTEKNPEHIEYYMIESIVNYLNGNCALPVSTAETGIRTNWVMDKILGKL